VQARDAPRDVSGTPNPEIPDFPLTLNHALVPSLDPPAHLPLMAVRRIIQGAANISTGISGGKLPVVAQRRSRRIKRSRRRMDLPLAVGSLPLAVGSLLSRPPHRRGSNAGSNVFTARPRFVHQTISCLCLGLENLHANGREGI
jgi:hypothetical protein